MLTCKNLLWLLFLNSVQITPFVNTDSACVLTFRKWKLSDEDQNLQDSGNRHMIVKHKYWKYKEGKNCRGHLDSHDFLLPWTGNTLKTLRKGRNIVSVHSMIPCTCNVRDTMLMAHCCKWYTALWIYRNILVLKCCCRMFWNFQFFLFIYFFIYLIIQNNS